MPKKTTSGPLSFDPTGDWGNWNAVMVKKQRKKGKRPVKMLSIPGFLEAFANSENYAMKDGNVWFLQDTYWAICDKLGIIETRFSCVLRFDELVFKEFDEQVFKGDRFVRFNQFSQFSDIAWKHATDGVCAIVPVSDVRDISEGMAQLRKDYLQYVEDEPAEARRRFEELLKMKSLSGCIR